VEELLNILAHGDDSQVVARIYNAEFLSDLARQIPLNFLRSLRAPWPEASLEVVERHPRGQFELVILRLSWRVKETEPGSEYHPLLVAEQGGSLRVVGFVLPWNELIPQLGPEMGTVMPLSLIWISRLTALTAGAKPAELDASAERPNE
jgi:hypothetical protein